MLHTQLFCAAEAAVAGSILVKVTSDRPVICARFATLTDMVMLPVEVVPSVPCVDAMAGVAVNATEIAQPNKVATCRTVAFPVFRIVTFTFAPEAIA